MKKIVLIVMLALIGLSANAQIAFQKAYGGTFSDIAYYVQQTADGGYIMAGTKDFGNNGDYYLIKTDINGAIVWTKTYGGSGDERCLYANQTFDGGYIMTGE